MRDKIRAVGIAIVAALLMVAGAGAASAHPSNFLGHYDRSWVWESGAYWHHDYAGSYDPNGAQRGHVHIYIVTKHGLWQPNHVDYRWHNV